MATIVLYTSRMIKFSGIVMGYAEVWKTLESMMIELKKESVAIPTNIMEDLRSAKQMIVLLENKDSSGETILKVEEYLNNVEGYLITEIQKKLGQEKADELLKKIEEANTTVENPQLKEKNKADKFVSGVPRDQKWIRVEPIESIPVGKLEELAKEQNLFFDKQKDGRLVIYGQPENIKKFVQQMTDLATKI